MPLFTPTTLRDEPVWQGDRLDAFWSAFVRTAERHLQKPYPARQHSRCATEFALIAEQAASMGDVAPAADVRAFIEYHFDAWHIQPTDGEPPAKVTGFFEPVLAVRREPDGEYCHPIHAQPANLVETGPDCSDAELVRMRFALSMPDGSLRPCPDRQQIETGGIDPDFAPVIAFAKDRVALFMVHVQGAARLIFDNGATARITFDGKSGHDFTGPGRVLVGLGELDAATVSMDAILRWLDAHPDRADDILWQNRSYIFFKELPDQPDDPGPVAAAKTPLTPHRSIAVDRLLWSFGLPFLVDVPDLNLPDGAPYRRVMVAQETGSAIIGPARADLFFGTGKAAGSLAGGVHHRAVFHVLLPKGYTPETGCAPETDWTGDDT